MPQATLEVPPAYVVVGVYRLVHDPKLWRPMWDECHQRVKRAAVMVLGWLLLSWPLQVLLVHTFMGRLGSLTGARATYDLFAGAAQRYHVPVAMPSFNTVTKLLLVLNQASYILEMSLGTLLYRFRRTAYSDTVQSRGKPAEWWTPYEEEWQKPPTAQGQSGPVPRKSMADQLYTRARTTLFRRVLRKVLAIMFSSIPLFGIIAYAALNALSYAQALHTPLFQAKHMTQQQVTLWMEERQTSYWLFGFTAQLAERLPFFGIIFSISNRIGAAMWAHDLEKRQQLARQGGVQPLKLEQTRASLQQAVQDGPGSYGDPQRADVALPGDFLARPADPSYGASAAATGAATSAGTRPVPRPPGTM